MPLFASCVPIVSEEHKRGLRMPECETNLKIVSIQVVKPQGCESVHVKYMLSCLYTVKFFIAKHQYCFVTGPALAEDCDQGM